MIWRWETANKFRKEEDDLALGDQLDLNTGRGEWKACLSVAGRRNKWHSSDSFRLGMKRESNLTMWFWLIRNAIVIKTEGSFRINIPFFHSPSLFFHCSPLKYHFIYFCYLWNCFLHSFTSFPNPIFHTVCQGYVVPRALTGISDEPLLFTCIFADTSSFRYLLSTMHAFVILSIMFCNFFFFFPSYALVISFLKLRPH